MKQRGRIPLIATVLAIAAAILLCAFLIARYRTQHVPVLPVQPATVAAPSATPEAPPPVAQSPAANSALLLNVQRQNGTATLSWNHDAPKVKNADYAMLLISDGRHREQLHLNKTELETGRVVYIPRSRDISFQLQLFAQSHSTTESIRSVADLPAPPPSDSSPRTPGDCPRSPATHQQSADTARPNPRPAPPAAPSAAPSTISQPPVQTTAPPAAAQTAPPQEAIVAEPETPKPNPFPEPDKTTPPKPREAEVATTVSLELIGHSGIKDVLDTLSPRHIFGSGSDKTTPPRVIRQILPGIYPAVASRIHGTRQVDVKITIGPGGQVVKTELVDDRTADPIDSVVYYAARQWTFEPARNGDKPVESKVLMHFVLKRSS